MWMIAYFLVLGGVGGSKTTDPVVDTKVGAIRGLHSDDGDYSMFLGIPYGKVDKNKPFGAATAYPKFEETFLAHDDTAKCPQVEEFNNTIVGTLDCLHLHIHVPIGATSSSKLPVLVFIYGGGFQFGFAGRYIYGPKYIVQHNVILVTLNYRLGPYGFMCLDDPEVPGNQGLKDQLLALRWINDNIESFGGDVNKVTLGGQSAGACSVDLHLLSKQEKLFSQAISQSCSILSPWSIPEPSYKTYEQPFILAEHLGYKSEKISDVLSFLAKADVKAVIGAAAELSMQFKLCVEKEFENVERFVYDYPRNLEVPKVKNTRILIGHNSHESGGYINKPESEYMNTFNVLLKEIFNHDENFSEMEDIVRDFYLGDKKLSKALQWKLINFVTDHDYIYPVHEIIQKYLDNGAEKIYHYVFSYSGDRNLMQKMDNINVDGAIHSDELSYLFDMTYAPSTPTKDDQRVIDMTAALWANFIKYGDPTPETTELLPIKWLPVTKEELHYLNINLTLSQGKGPFNERMAFWKLFIKANRDKLKGYQTLD